MSLSDSSSVLSSPPSSDNEVEPPPPPQPVLTQKTLKLKGGKLTAASQNASQNASPQSSPEPPAREPSPPHEYVLADNPDIAFLVMFRARFADAFPKNVPNLGPQDVERGVVESQPSEQIEHFLCALLGLVLNRKKYVERGHHGRALEEAISTQRSQWPISWQGINPLPGTKTFTDLNPTERLDLLKTLVLWALNSSELIAGFIKESYKQHRQNDDINQPLSIQPWGSDARKRRYWLIEGQHDTPFRLYRESAPRIVNKTWWSVAGTIDELKLIGEELNADGSQAGRRLAERITAAVPRLEETQEKRKRKEYRQARRAAFTRPEPGYSLYEGRTRGKKMKYTFSDEEDFSESNSTRRSTRHSNGSTPGDLNGPTVTASGRHVRSRFGRSYGEPLDQSREGTATMESSETGEAEGFGYSTRANGRPQRSSARAYGKRARDGYSPDDELGDDDGHETEPSGDEWQGDDDDIEGKLDQDDDDESSGNASDDSLMEDTPTLVITLRYKPNAIKSPDHATNETDGPSSNTHPETNGSPLPHLQSPTVAHRPKFNSTWEPETKPPSSSFIQSNINLPQPSSNEPVVNGWSKPLHPHLNANLPSNPINSNEQQTPPQNPIPQRSPVTTAANAMSISSFTPPDISNSTGNYNSPPAFSAAGERPPQPPNSAMSYGSFQHPPPPGSYSPPKPAFPHQLLGDEHAQLSYNDQYQTPQDSRPTNFDSPNLPKNPYPTSAVTWNQS